MSAPPKRPHPVSRFLLRHTGYQAAPPRGVIMEVTNRCTYRCPICEPQSRRDRGPQGDMRPDIFEAVLRDLPALAPERVSLYGRGEPLLNSRIVEMVARIARLGLPTEIVTNGDLLTPEIVRDLKSAGLSSLVISEPGINQQNYAACRGCPARPDRRESICRALTGLTDGSPAVSLRSLVMPDLVTAAELHAFNTAWFTCRALGSIALHGYLPWPQLVLEDRVGAFKSRPLACKLAMDRLLVCWDGSVTPCPYDTDTLLSLGAIPGDSMPAMYNAARLRSLRRLWLRPKRPWPKPCMSCLLPRVSSPIIVISRAQHEEFTPAKSEGYMKAALRQLGAVK